MPPCTPGGCGEGCNGVGRGAPSLKSFGVDLRARCAAASPPLRRSHELSGGGCRPVEEPSPLSPRMIAGFKSSASAGPIGLTSARWALDFGVFAGFFGESGFFAMRRIWGRASRRKRVSGEVVGGAKPLQCFRHLRVNPVPDGCLMAVVVEAEGDDGDADQRLC